MSDLNINDCHLHYSLHSNENEKDSKKSVSCQTETTFTSRFLDDYEPKRRLGRGGFGIVLEAHNKLVDISYAVKRIPLPLTYQARKKVMREVQSHARLGHQHIVRYFVTWTETPPPGWQSKTDAMLASMTGASITDPGWTREEEGTEETSPRGVHFEEPAGSSHNEESPGGIQFKETPGGIQSERSSAGFHMEIAESNQLEITNDNLLSEYSSRNNREAPKEFLYIAMELCAGSLKDCILSRILPTRKNALATKWFRQICCGLSYIHKQGLIHRDLKPENIYISEKNCIKIGDFGLARDIRQSDWGHRIDNQPDKLSHYVGTRLYMAPEMKKSGQRYTNKVDIYSLGLILVELLIPFSTEAERCKTLTSVKKKSQTGIQACLQEWGPLVSKMVNKRPFVRPSACQVLRECPKAKKKNEER
jgi:serine/threonine protein kinase